MKFVYAFLIISIVIIVHELGHFIIAKASGVKVVEFSVGMGPRLVKFKIKGTLYSIKLFLFGGSCQMLGEDLYESTDAVAKVKEDNPTDKSQENIVPDESDGVSFNSVSVWKRIAIIIAGPLFNFILAFVFAVILIGKMGYNPVQVYSVDDNSPAYYAGLKEGDRIIRVNGKKMNFYDDYYLYMYDKKGIDLNVEYIRDGEKYKTTIIPEHITGSVYQMGVQIDVNSTKIAAVEKGTPADSAGIKAGDIIKSINGTAVSEQPEITPLVQQSEGKEITITVECDGRNVELKLTPKEVQQDYYDYGIYFANLRVKCSPAGTLKYAFKNIGYQIKSVFVSLRLLVTGKLGLDDVSGPVGIVSFIGEVVDEAKSDGAFYVFINLLNMCIMISANLGVMNLLPLPALDGGKLVFLLIEAVRGKPVPREKEGMVHFVGIILLMVLMVVVLFNDISKLFR